MNTDQPLSTTGFQTPPKQVRIRTITESGDELLRFYTLLIQPYRSNLVRSIFVFEQKILPLIGWLLESEGKQAWKWHSAITVRPPYFSIRYSRNDDLLSDLQNPEFRDAFEKAFRLYQEYLTIFQTVLEMPDLSAKFAEKAQAWFATHSADSIGVRKASADCLSVIRSPANLRRWGKDGV